MSDKQVNFGIVLSCVFILCGPAGLRAQDLDVSPLSWDFGSVAVGSSSTATFDLLSAGPSEVYIYVVALYESDDLTAPHADPRDWESPSWSLGAFSFDPATYPILFPVVSSPGSHTFLDVIFTPPAEGDYQAYLFIMSNDSVPPPGPYPFLPLKGAGVPAAVPVPGAALLTLLGVSIVGYLRRRTL